MSSDHMEPGGIEMEPYFEGYGEPHEIWEGRIAKGVQRLKYLNWIMEMSDWKVFVTLTFREDKPIDSAKSYFRKLVRELNSNVFSKRYTSRVGHSYFSYVLAAEYQLRGVIHFHFLADKPLNFQLIHDVWNDWAGFAQTEVIENKRAAVRYVVKYLVKSGEPEFYLSHFDGVPVVKPTWWDLLSAANDEASGQS